MKLSAVLLAGGESRRMGRDKATLLWNGHALWENQLALLRKLQPFEIFVSARTDPDWRPAGVEFVGDEKPSCGPLSGLSAALQRARGTHLLALAIDMPFLTETWLRLLQNETAPARGAVAAIGDRLEPLAAIYPTETARHFIDALRGPDFSLQKLVRRLVAADRMRLLQIPSAEASLFRNLNSPEDLSAATTAELP